MAYKLSKRASLMDKYHAACQRVRRQIVRVEIEQTKVHTLEVALNKAKHKLRVKEKEQRRLLKIQWDVHAGFTPNEQRRHE